MKSVVRFAEEILAMDNEIQRLQQENAHLREIKKKYEDMVENSIFHSQEMMNNTLGLLLRPGVAAALEKSK